MREGLSIGKTQENKHSREQRIQEIKAQEKEQTSLIEFEQRKLGIFRKEKTPTIAEIQTAYSIYTGRVLI